MFLRKNNSVTKNFHTPPPAPPPRPRPQNTQSWCNNKYSQQFLCEIWTTTTNTSNKYIKPAMSLYSLSINVHTISNPQYNDIICMLTNHFVWTMRWLRLRLRLHRLLECSRTIYNHWLYIATVHSQAGRCICIQHSYPHDWLFDAVTNTLTWVAHWLYITTGRAGYMHFYAYNTLGYHHLFRWQTLLIIDYMMQWPIYLHELCACMCLSW